MENNFGWLKLKKKKERGEGKYIGRLLDLEVTHGIQTCVKHLKRAEIRQALGTTDERVLLSI